MKQPLIFLSCALSTLCAIVSPLGAEETPEKLIQKLSSDEFEERERAQRELLKLGAGAREKIAAALKQPNLDADIVTRLKLIQEKIGHDDVLKAYDAPKKISLELKGERVEDALAKLKEHFGFEIAAEGAAGEKKIDLSIKDLSLFEALEAIRAKADLGYEIRNKFEESDTKKLLVQLKEKPEKAAMPAIASGPLLIFIENISMNVQRQLRSNADKAEETRSLQINGQLLTDPTLNFSGLEAGDLEVKDATGAAIQANFHVDQEHWREARGSGQVYRFYLNSQVKDKELKAPLSIKFGATLEVPLRMGEKKIEDLAGAKGKQVDLNGGSITVNKVEPKNNSWELSVTGVGIGMELLNNSSSMHSGLGRRMQARAAIRARGGGAPAGGTSGSVPENTAGFFILDGQGNPIERNGYSGSGNGKQYEVTLTLQGEPKSIVMKWVEEKADRKVNVQLKDVPLP
jgi:hypothetical protein